MLTFALNHMTVPSLTMKNVGDLARSLGMSGIELRNDLAQRLFDGQTPVAGMTDGMTVIALAEVKAFNAFDDATFERSVALMDLAVACGITLWIEFEHFHMTFGIAVGFDLLRSRAHRGRPPVAHIGST